MNPLANTSLARYAVASLALLVGVVPAHATITGVFSQAQQIAAPASCLSFALTGPNAFAWNEQQNISVTGLFCDETQNPGGNTSPVPGTLSGTFNSHMLHFQGIPNSSAVGSVTFATPIVGLMFNRLALDLSDASCGALGTAYPTGYTGRGISLVTPSFISISGNVLTFNLSWAPPVGDLPQVRVITAVPAPASAALLGLSGLVAIRRRRA